MRCEVELGEKLYSLAAAVEKATGQRPSPSTCWRWTRKRDNPLPYLLLGGRPMTSEEAVGRWMVARTAAANGEAEPSRTNRQRERDIAAAESECSELGI